MKWSTAMIEYFMKYPNKIIDPLLEHLSITIEVLLYSLVLAMLITLLIMNHKILSSVVVGFFSGFYCIPSLAVFALCIPFLGLGRQTVIVVLVVYNQFYLIRSFLTGIQNVDASVCEAAIGCGMTKMQLFWKVQFPLSLPAMIAGIRVATLSTISIATIGASINGGGLGVILFDGMRTRNSVKILWGVVLAAILNLLMARLLMMLEQYSRRKIHM